MAGEGECNTLYVFGLKNVFNTKNEFPLQHITMQQQNKISCV
jgi:hypothetical protein